MIQLLIIFSVLAVVFPLSKAALAYSPAIFLTASRTLLGGIILLAYYVIADRRRIFVNSTFMQLLIATTIFNVYCTQVLQFWALYYVPTAVGCLIYNTAPFFAAILSYVLLAEPMHKAKWIGLSIAFMGLIPLVIAQATDGPLYHTGTKMLWALGALFTAAGANAYGSIILWRIARTPNLSMSLINGLSMLLGGGVMFMTSFVLEEWSTLPNNMGLWFVTFVVPLALLANVAAFSLFGFFMRCYSPTVVMCAMLVQIVAAAVYSWLFLHESLSWLLGIALIGILVGMYYFTKEIE